MGSYYLQQATFVFIILNILLFVILGAGKIIAKIKKKTFKLSNAWLHSLIFTYILTLFSLTFVYWDFSIDPEGFSVSINLSGYKSLNLIPFKTMFNYLFSDNTFVSEWQSVSLTNIFGNIAFFVPIGFLLALIHKKSLKFSMIAGFSLSLFIEIVQYFTGRVSDIDDLLLNVLGTFFGYIVGKFFLKKLQPMV